MERKSRVLVVDDDTNLRANIQDILELNEYSVECATNGREAIELSKKGKYDMALIDIRLPDISGIEIVKEMGRISPSTDIIYMTGNATLESAIESAKQENVISYETKPLDMDRLLSLIKQIASRKQAENQLRYFEHIASSSTDYMAIFDKNFIYLAVNTAYLKAFNKASDELIGNVVANVLGEEFFNSFIKPNADLCMTGKKINYQAWLNYPAYGKRYMDINYYPYISDNYKVVGFVLNARDITKRKEAEQKIKRQSDQLRQMVNIATHDLKSSIISASGFTKMSLELTKKTSGKKEKDLPQELEEYAESINQHINKALDILTEFLEGRKITRVVEPLDQPVKFEKQPVENFPDIKKEYRKKQIFLIDDDKAACFLTKKMIERDIDAEVTSMTNPLEAEKCLEKNNYTPDLILIDINMPEKNGFEVLDDLKAIKRLEGTYFAIYSTSAFEKNINTAKEKDVGYIVKSYDTLSSKIDEILHGKIIYP